MSDEKYCIFLYNWWPGFETRDDANHIGFFEMLFSNTHLKQFEITTDIDKANVLLDAGKPDVDIRFVKKWKYTINFIGEPALPDSEKYDLLLTSVNNIKNVVDMPLVVMYIHCNNFLPRLRNLPVVSRVPSFFCSFVVSNPKCEMRNKIFERLNSYKKVNSMGRYENNMGGVLPYSYWTEPYFNIIGQHKFMICCENTKMTTYSTEKIANPYIARTIPIYWGTHNIKNIFNPDSMLFLEDESEESLDRLIERVVELDNNDDKYIEFINRPIFNEHAMNFWNNHYSLSSLAKKIDAVLL